MTPQFLYINHNINSTIGTKKLSTLFVENFISKCGNVVNMWKTLPFFRIHRAVFLTNTYSHKPTKMCVSYPQTVC
jgi:hypothetical protein